ncbi:glycerophosphodiester phosphodiesterase [Bacillus sp. FJAT-47783]|uniref:glycerophosphodiester phosphodiesterase n=1 Tax=Bacillus sp. FJAT-47783 TaxID=2922712 RepID=UPI001FAD8E02|nr:glycerophosphodiester phosphodiesterase [Bacillus sp. FJAT-47783]
MTKIFAHRGASKQYPENTMLAFEAAYLQGANGIELDVQMTKDGVLVVIHDETLDRTTNATGWVKDYTYREIQHVDASYTFTQFLGRCPIPKLEEVLSWAKKRQPFFLNIELKNSVIDYFQLEEKVVDMVKQFRLEDRVILSSFNHYSLVRLHRIAKDIETAILYSEWLYEPWDYCKKIGVNGLHPHYRSLKNELVIKEAKKHNVPIRPYTVNKMKDIERFFRLEVEAIITDFPEKAIQKKSVN